MTNIGLEQISALFQVWPESFKERFGRNLTKQELFEAIQEHANCLELKEIHKKFELYCFQDLLRIQKFISDNEIEHIDPCLDKAQNYKQIDSIKSKDKRLD